MNLNQPLNMCARFAMTWGSKPMAGRTRRGQGRSRQTRDLARRMRMLARLIRR